AGMVGNDRSARGLFIQLVMAEPWLVDAINAPVDELRTEFERRCAFVNLYRAHGQGTNRSLNTIAALLVAAALPDCRPSATAAACLTACIPEGEYGQVMQQAERPEPLE